MRNNKGFEYRLVLWRKNETGAVIVMVAIVLIVLLSIAALAVDIGYLLASRNELQNAADASALAATRKLGSIYAGMTSEQQAAYTCNPNDIIPVAQDAAASNSAAGKAVSVLSEDVIIGKWDPVKKELTPTLERPNAVRVNTRRDGKTEVGTFFARIFNIESRPVTAFATAALTGLGEIKKGELDIPVGISETWFARGWKCGQSITFYPTNDSCAGWTNWTDDKGDKVSDNDLKNDILPGLINGTLEAPGAKFNETTWWFTGGNLSQPTWTKMDELFQKNAVDGKWTVQVVVYRFSGDSGSSCGNPNPKDGPLLIVGFATLVLEEVVVPPSSPGGAPQKSLQGTVYCEYVADGRGAGVYYGTYGTIPGLVQ